MGLWNWLFGETRGMPAARDARFPVIETAPAPSLEELCAELADATDAKDGWRQEPAMRAIKELGNPKGIPALLSAFLTSASIYESGLSDPSVYPAFAVLDALFALGWQPNDSATEAKVRRVIELYRYEWDSPEMLRMADQLERSLNPAVAPNSSSVVEPGPGLVDNGDGTLTDATSGLMWQKEDDGETRTRDEAAAYCRGLNLAGYTDWRLPTLQEFQALSRAASGNEFGVVAHVSLSAGDVYWTATPGPQSNVSHVADGTTMFNTNKYPVRAVRRV